MLENQNTQKRRMPKAGTMILAAALAVGCVLSIAAGLPAQVYNFVGGGTVSVTEGTSEVSMTLDGAEAKSPITVENSRLWLEADGKKVDITDKIDENTPYVVERTDPATGNKGYLVAGGTVEDLGWAEFFLTKDGTCSMVGENAWEYMVPIDGKDIPLTQLTQEQRDMLNEDGSTLCKTVNRPWLDKAITQLDLEMELALVD